MIERLENGNNDIDKELVLLTQDLIRIPSWVSEDEQDNEKLVTDFLESWMKKNTNMEVVRQDLGNNRSNLICKKGNPDLVFLAHTDTVAPIANEEYSKLSGEIQEGKLWGRGSTDMKSGLAAVAQALALSPESNNVWFIMYCDEEYDFKGMKAILSEYGDIRPKLIVSADGSDLEIGHGCRGLIDFQSILRGKSGHPAKGTGLNAINGVAKIESFLTNYVKQYSHPIMGGTSINIGNSIGGGELPNGKSIDKNGHVYQVKKENNVTADIAEFGMDIRPSSLDLDFNKINELLSDEAKRLGYSYQLVSRKHDYGAWYTPREDLTKYGSVFEQSFGRPVVYADPNKTGYLDLQMFWETVGRPPAFSFGGGVGETAHKDDEHMKIEDLIKTRDFFIKTIEFFNSKNAQ
jgi:succinyl-diaminopimelate desuccinylase